jgi:ketosteroid isomerase-like protein
LSKCLGVQEEIQQLKNDFEKAMKSKDIKAIVSLYSDDAVIVYGKMMPICKDSKEFVNLVF